MTFVKRPPPTKIWQVWCCPFVELIRTLIYTDNGGKKSGDGIRHAVVVSRIFPMSNLRWNNDVRNTWLNLRLYWNGILYYLTLKTFVANAFRILDPLDNCMWSFCIACMWSKVLKQDDSFTWYDLASRGSLQLRCKLLEVYQWLFYNICTAGVLLAKHREYRMRKMQNHQATMGYHSPWFW